MANAKAVEELLTSRKSRKKTNVFWSTVPENEQFKNVHVPGVSSGAYKEVETKPQAQKHVQVVQKSKSDSAILSINLSDPLTVNKQRIKTSFKVAANQNDSSTGQREAHNVSKGLGDKVANISGLSESSNSRRASLKNLNVDDKKRVANLIKELAKTGEERELALEKLQEERVSYEERLSTVQQEQNLLREERESLKERLEESEKLLKRYESEIKEAKKVKVLKKFKVHPQSTQTSPLTSKDVNDQPLRIKKTLSSETYVVDEHTGLEKVQVQKSVDRMQQHGSTSDRTSSMASCQVPIYSNSLFDVKVSSVDIGHEESSKPQGVREEDRHAMETSSLHELYLREYWLQLRLQEQQIEIQRQQVQLQQQLQLLQQQQGLVRRQQEDSSCQQTHEEQRLYQQKTSHHSHQRHESTQQGEERKNGRQQSKNEQALHRDQQEEERRKLSGGMIKQYDQQGEDLYQDHHQKQASLDEKSHQQGLDYLSGQNNKTVFKQYSPTQQTNFLQKRTPKRENRRTESQHPLELSQEHSQQQGHSRDHVIEESGKRKTAHFYRSQGEMQLNDRTYMPPKGASTPPPHEDVYYVEHNVEKVHIVEEQHMNEYHDKHSKDSTYYHKQNSPRKPHTTDAKHIDVNNNEYFQMSSHSLHKDAVMENHDNHNYSFESHSESEYEADDERRSRSAHPCHCGHYHTRQNLTSEYNHPTSKDRHSEALAQHARQDRRNSPQRKSHLNAEPLFYLETNHSLDQKSQQRTHYSHPKAESLARPVETNYRQSDHQQHKDYHQKLNNHPKQAQLPDSEKPLLYQHKNKYDQHPDSLEEHVLHSPHYATHQRQQRRKQEYTAAAYPSSKKASKTRGTTERVHLQHHAGSSTEAMLPQQARLSDYDYLSSEEQQHSQVDRSKELLDDYIYNHQSASEYDTKPNSGYDSQENYKQPTKRVISKRIAEKRQREIETLERGTDSVRLLVNEGLNPGYSLYKPNTPRGKQRFRNPPGWNHSTHPKSNYPDSLIDIVEGLEISTGYEERYSEETEEKAGYDSDEEESSVLDNVFFLKR